MPVAEYHIKLAKIADHRMWDLFNKQNLIYRFMGHIMPSSESLAREFRVLHSQWQLFLCRPDFTICALLAEAIFDRCAPRVRYDTSKKA